MIGQVNDVSQKAFRGKGFHLIIVHFFFQKVTKSDTQTLFANYANPRFELFEFNVFI